MNYKVLLLDADTDRCIDIYECQSLTEVRIRQTTLRRVKGTYVVAVDGEGLELINPKQEWR